MKKLLIILGLVFIFLSSFVSATIADDANSGARSYYKLEEAALNYVDATGAIDLTVGSTTDRVAAVIDFGQDYERTSGDGLSTIAAEGNELSYPGYSVWVNYEGGQGGDTEHYVIGNVELFAGSFYGLSCRISESTDIINCFGGTGGATFTSSSGGVINTGVDTHILAIYDGRQTNIYINGINVTTVNTVTATGALGYQGGTVTEMFIGDSYNSRGFDGVIDEVAIFDNGNTIDQQALATFLYNSGNPGTNQQYIFSVPAVDVFELTTSDIFAGTSIINFSANIINLTGSFIINTSNGSIFWPLNQMVNISIFNASINNMSVTHFDETFNNKDTDFNFDAELTPFFNFHNITMSNFTTFNNINYTRSLNYGLNLTCRSGSNSFANLFLNGVLEDTVSFSCNNNTQVFTNSLTASSEGAKNFSIKLFNDDIGNETVFENDFTWDLLAPVTSITFTTRNVFNNSANVTLICSDSIFPNLNYSSFFNGVELFTGNLSNGTMQSNQSSFISEVNNATGICLDPFSSSKKTTLQNVFFTVLNLWDEILNEPFDVSNVSNAVVFFSDINVFSFKDEGVSFVNYTSLNNTQLRFVITYFDSTEITRFIDVGFVDDDPLKICANTDERTHFEQQIISSSERVAIMKNTFSGCYVAADKVRFAFQNAFVLKAFTVNGIYFLITFDSDGNEIMLASVDGSTTSFINLDVLDFIRQPANFDISGDGLSFEKFTNTSINIFYDNINEDNVESKLTITRVDTNQVLLNVDGFADPNSFIVLFDYTTLNITTETIFEIKIDAVDDQGEESIIKRFFNAQAQQGFIPAAIAGTIAFFLLFFSINFVATSQTFSWFGLFMNLIVLFILAFSVPAWFITFLMVIDILSFVYIGLNMVMKNFAQVS